MGKNSTVLVVFASLICCIFMTVVDGIWQPGYVIKSAVKLVLFLLLPLICSLFNRQIAFRSLFRGNKRGLALALGLGILLFAVILAGYFLLSAHFDFSNVASSLTASTGVDKSNFFFVSLYISFVNSLLEEFFFRGFVFTNLKNTSPRIFAHGFSAVLFSLLVLFSPVFVGFGRACGRGRDFQSAQRKGRHGLRLLDGTYVCQFCHQYDRISFVKMIIGLR